LIFCHVFLLLHTFRQYVQKKFLNIDFKINEFIIDYIIKINTMSKKENYVSRIKGSSKKSKAMDNHYWCFIDTRFV
jgi:hypothetical protein